MNRVHFNQLLKYTPEHVSNEDEFQSSNICSFSWTSELLMQWTASFSGHQNILKKRAHLTLQVKLFNLSIWTQIRMPSNVQINLSPEGSTGRCTLPHLTLWDWNKAMITYPVSTNRIGALSSQAVKSFEPAQPTQRSNTTNASEFENKKDFRMLVVHKASK